MTGVQTCALPILQGIIDDELTDENLGKCDLVILSLYPEASIIDRLRSYVEPLVSQDIILARGRGKGTKYYVNPAIISDSKANIQTTLKAIEPYRLKELIKQDLKYHSHSLVSDISQRLPDVPFKDLQKMVRRMASEGELIPDGGRKFRRYRLP